MKKKTKKKPVDWAKRYAKLCPRCKRGLAPSRAVVFGTVLWLHDNTLACPAGELREQQRESAATA